MFDLSLEEAFRYRPFEVVAPGFVAVDEPGPTPYGLQRSDEGPVAPFAAVEISAAGLAGSRTQLLAGLAGDDEYLLAVYDAARGRVVLELRQRGRTRVLRRRKVQPSDALRLGFVLCESQVTVLLDSGDGWRAVLTDRAKVLAALDLRARETLARFTYAWGHRAAPAASGKQAPAAIVSGVRAGLFGMTGLRDLHLVQHADGRPWVRDGRAYLTATCAGLGFFRQAHWGVFTLDLARPGPLEQVGQLYFERDGLVLGDHAGQVVRDDEQQRWIVATSSWGDFDFTGVHVRHLHTEADVLHGVHVLSAEPTRLPTRHSSWDPGLTRIDGAWHVSFVESPSQKPFDFRPALAVARADPWEDTLELVGAATDLHQCEGPILARLGDDWLLLASDGEHRSYPAYRLDMTRVGHLDAPYPSNIPHPQLVPREEGGYLLVTFDGTQFDEDVLGYGAHGDVIVMAERPVTQ